MTRPSVQLIADAVFARLVSLAPDVTFYRGQLNASIPILPATGRIITYGILHSFGPVDGPDADVGDQPIDLTYTCQIDVVAGYEADCQYATDLVVAKMDRWAPVVTGLVVGRFRPPPGYDPGPFRPDDVVQPSRFSIPLQYRTTATT